MSSDTLTYSDLLSKLVIEGALGIVAGSVEGKAPGEPQMLTRAEREQLGLAEEGITLLYETGEDGVLFDMSGSTVTVWYNGGDCERALPVFEKALQAAYPRAKQVKDERNAMDEEMRSRTYEVELGGARVAALDVTYPKPGGKPRRPHFGVRVFALRRE
ncbi:MAG: hypothetical protein R3C25_01125 [Hyphomonadaceae bacterium]